MISGSSSGHGELESVIVDGADELAMSIERAVAFVATSEYGGMSLGKVFLCGGGSQLPGLPELLADRTRARTEVATPLQLLRVRPGATQLPTHELAPMFMLPVGLALRATA